MKIWILVLPLALGLANCKKTRQQNTAELQTLIDDSCAQNPVNFIEEEEKSNQKLYIFGPQDSEFRQQWQTLQSSFRASGRDLSGAEKLAFVAKYMPRFLQGCTQYFAGAVAECSRFGVDSPELARCLEPHNAGFRRYLAQSLKVDDKGWVDLESFPQQ